MKDIEMLTPSLHARIALFCTGCISLFFLLILHFKWSYSVFPILLSLIGIGALISAIKQRQYRLNNHDKWLIIAFVGYFLLFLLSFVIHQGKIKELDLPSRLLLALPLLAVCYRFKPNAMWILYSIIVATLCAGIVAIVQLFVLKREGIFPAHMYIQSGGIITSLAMFSLSAAFFFQRRQMKTWQWLSLIACVLGIFAALINQSRGSWVIAPFLIFIILWFNRQLLSKRLIGFLLVTAFIAGGLSADFIEKRWQQAHSDITEYLEHNNGSSSLGARFDMWESALLGIQEKPIFGWGLQGVKTMRQQHSQQKHISEVAATFDHAHNQYLHDASARGLIGLVALLAIFIVPLAIFWRQMKHAATQSFGYLWGELGIVHILAVMGYCLSQSFLSHNSGIMFYGVTVVLLLGLQKMALNAPLAKEKI